MTYKSVIIRAAQLAARAHASQKRKYSDLPYIVHPARVAGHVALLTDATDELVAAAWLHDTLEDTELTFAHIEDECGVAVAELVTWLTNIKQPGLPRGEQKELDRARLADAPYEAKLIKCCDRLDNLNDMPAIEFRRTYARESVQLIDMMNYTCNKLSLQPVAVELFNRATWLSKALADAV